MIDLNGIYRPRAYSFPFLPPRWLHNEVNKPKAGLSPQLSVAKFQRACMHARARAPVCVTRIRVHGHAGATWWTNIHTVVLLASRWLAGQVPHCLETRDLEWSRRPQGLRLIVFREKELLLFVSCVFNRAFDEISKNCMIIQSAWNGDVAKCQAELLDAIERISLKIEIIVYL